MTNHSSVGGQSVAAANRTGGANQPLAPLPGGSSDGFLVWDLSAADYVSEEYLLPGRADVYEPVSMVDGMDRARLDLASMGANRDFVAKVVEADLPFVTRVIVYRPRDPAKFSGNVLCEVLHIGGGGHPVAFTTVQPFVLGNGDVIVGVQHPDNFAEVRAANPARYGAMSAVHATQIWGMIIEAARQIRQGGLQGLDGFHIERQFLAGRSFTGVATATFANFHHHRAKLDDGSNAFDGYLPMTCGYYVRPLDVPVIRINSLSEFSRFGLDTRSRDSDEPGRQSRLYEVAGACHYFMMAPPVGVAPQSGSAPADGQGGVPGGPASWLAGFGPDTRQNDLPVYLLASAALANLYRWSRGGEAPPRADLYDCAPDGQPLLDDFGNVRGGVRSPYLDAPAACYGAGAREFQMHGYTRPFSKAELRTLYGSESAYVARFEQALERCVAHGWVLPADRSKMLDDARNVRFD